RHAVAVGVLAQLAAGEVVARAGDRPGRPFGFRAGTDAGVGVAGALALLGPRAFAAAEAGVEHVRVGNAKLVDRLAVGQLGADLSVPDLLLHEHAALQRGPGNLVLLLGGVVLGVEGERGALAGLGVGVHEAVLGAGRHEAGLMGGLVGD